MTDVEPTTTPRAGWYPDPAGGPRTRWWNGAAWSDTFGEPIASAQTGVLPPAGRPAYAEFADAPAYSTAAAGPAQRLAAPAGTSPYTPFVWGLALLPLVAIVSTLISSLTIEQQVAAALDPDAAVIAPVDLVQGLVGWVVIGLGVLLAVLDWRALQRAGVPRPFHWAWGFFLVVGAPVYLVGRSIVVHRSVGAGYPPMVLNLALIAVNFVIGVVAAITVVSTMLPALAA